MHPRILGLKRKHITTTIYFNTTNTMIYKTSPPPNTNCQHMQCLNRQHQHCLHCQHSTKLTSASSPLTPSAKHCSALLAPLTFWLISHTSPSPPPPIFCLLLCFLPCSRKSNVNVKPTPSQECQICLDYTISITCSERNYHLV